MKKVLKNLMLVMVMTVLCMAVAVTANAAECNHDRDRIADSFVSDCAEGGEVHYWCSLCGKSWSEIIEPRDYHEWVGYPTDEELANFCNERDYWVYCRICGYGTYVYLQGTAEHDWRPDYAESDTYSCTEGGELCYWCINCQTSKYEYAGPIGAHDWDDYPTEEELASFCGVEERELWCDRCGRCENISLTGTAEHNWHIEQEAEEYTYNCVSGGDVAYECRGCRNIRAEYCAPTGAHNWGSDYPTDTELATFCGERDFEVACDVCDYRDRLFIEGTSTDHKYNDWVIVSEISCTQNGISVRSCKRCSCIDVANEKAYGHSDSNSDGKCDECSVVLESTGTATPDDSHTEHTFGEWVTEGSLSLRQCTECGHMEMKIVTDGGDVEIEYPESDEQSGCGFDVEVVEGEGFVLIEEKVAEEIGVNIEVLKAFDINLKNSDGVHVQPDGAVKVKLPLDWEKEGNYKVYRDNGDGTFTDMNAVRQGSHMVFDTDHFSVYIIVEEVAVSDAPSDAETEQPEKETNVFDFLTNFFNSILDFFKKLFGIG